MKKRGTRDRVGAARVFLFHHLTSFASHNTITSLDSYDRPLFQRFPRISLHILFNLFSISSHLSSAIPILGHLASAPFSITNWVSPFLPSRPCLRNLSTLLRKDIFLAFEGPSSCLMPTMSLSQPASAEKTIRKIDIAQVRTTLVGRKGSMETSGLEAAVGVHGPFNPSGTAEEMTGDPVRQSS